MASAKKANVVKMLESAKKKEAKAEKEAAQKDNPMYADEEADQVTDIEAVGEWQLHTPTVQSTCGCA